MLFETHTQKTPQTWHTINPVTYEKRQALLFVVEFHPALVLPIGQHSDEVELCPYSNHVTEVIVGFVSGHQYFLETLWSNNKQNMWITQLHEINMLSESYIRLIIKERIVHLHL